VDDFCQIPAKEGECPFRAGYANGHIMTVQDENMAVQA
jgi:hypothetical protein